MTCYEPVDLEYVVQLDNPETSTEGQIVVCGETIVISPIKK